VILAWFGAPPPLIEPGSPWKNGRQEISNDKLQDEVAQRDGIATPREARLLIEAPRLGYDSVPAAPSARLQPAANVLGRSGRYYVQLLIMAPMLCTTNVALGPIR
jgi:hypothetical protein